MRRWIVVVGMLALASACADRGTGACDGDYVATAADFDCLLTVPEVDGVRVLNRCGRQEDAEAVIRDNVKGVQFPVGTIIQVVPSEAMVKRAPGYDARNNDWEYFSLGFGPGGPSITQRGRVEVANNVGSCLACHAGAREWDFQCRGDHGCGKLPLPHSALTATQHVDPRCFLP